MFETFSSYVEANLHSGVKVDGATAKKAGDLFGEPLKHQKTVHESCTPSTFRLDVPGS